MPWPIDQKKLDRVLALMKDQDVTALVVRARQHPLSHQLLVHEGIRRGGVSPRRRSHTHRD